MVEGIEAGDDHAAPRCHLIDMHDRSPLRVGDQHFGAVRRPEGPMNVPGDITLTKSSNKGMDAVEEPHPDIGIGIEPPPPIGRLGYEVDAGQPQV